MLIAAVVVAAVVAIAGFAWLTYDRLTRLRLATESSWAQIEAALKLRHDLVPSLVRIIAAYASHERASFERVALARGAAVGAAGSGPARRGALEASLGVRIGSLVTLAEAHPELEASDRYATLRDHLVSVENRIAITRRAYNDAVETLNTAVAVFPASLLARAAGLSGRELFSAGIEVSATPPAPQAGEAGSSAVAGEVGSGAVDSRCS